MFIIATPIKKIIKIRVYLWLWMLYIWQKYTFLITIMVWFFLNKLKYKIQDSKKQGLEKNQIAYMKHIKIWSSNMVIIFTPKHMIQKRQKCVRIHSQIMLYHTGNISCDVVPNFQALIFLTKKQMINIPTLVLHFVFIFIIYLYAVQHMEGFC